MGKTIDIGGRIHNPEVGNVVTGANEIYDDTKGKKQDVINGEVDAALEALDANKQDNLTFDQTPTESSTNPVTSGGVYAADLALQQAIEAILTLIPSAASALNQLADKSFVNSSIATASATFRGTYNLVSDLHLSVTASHQDIATALASAVSTADNNDYCFVQVPTSDTSSDIRVTERYKFNGSVWGYEYDLNNSGFTATQWEAINSGITALLVTKLGALPTAAELATSLAGKQNVLTFDNVPVSGSDNPVKSGGLYQLFTAIDAKFPSDASSSNKLVAENRLAAYVTAVIEALDASFDLTSADGHVTFRMTQTNGVIASVQILTSDIASASALTTLGGRVSTNETDIANLQAAYAGLTQSDIIVGTLPSSGQQQNVIYRQPDPDHNPPQFYSDYMWNGSTWVLMATYNNAIDSEPTAGSQNLTTSGGILNYLSSKDTNNELVNGVLTEIYDPNNVLGNAKTIYTQNTSIGVKQLWAYNGAALVLAANLNAAGEGLFSLTNGLKVYIKKFKLFSVSDIVVNSANTAILENHPYIYSRLKCEIAEVDIATMKPDLLNIKSDIYPTNNMNFNSYIPEIFDPSGVLDNATAILLNLTPEFLQLFAYNGSTQIMGKNVEVLSAGVNIDKVYLLNGVYFYIKKRPVTSTTFALSMNDNAHVLMANPTIYEHINHINKVSLRGMNIAWFGTSIPTGKYYSRVAFSGFSIVAQYKMTPYYSTNYDCPDCYPAMVGALLGANVYNESEGSSSIAKNYSTNLRYRCICLANSIQDICDFITGCYNIDWVNHTATRITDNPYNITEFFANDDTWEGFINNLYANLCCSYEIALVCHHLIPNGQTHDDYVESKFGDYYNSFASALDMNLLCGFISDIDLFMFDHGVNDSNFTGGVDSADLFSFYGAYNLIIKTVFMYKASALMGIVSDYMHRSTDKIVHQKAIADKWGIPFAYIPDMTPSLSDIVVQTQGYWDTNHIWHDSGFEFTTNGDTFTSNNAIFSGMTLSQVVEVYNPTEIDGIMTWTTTTKNTWLYDGLHPHQDSEGRINKIYASALSEWIKSIGEKRNPTPQLFY